LGTRDPAEAKRAHAVNWAEIEERWSNLWRGQRPISPLTFDDAIQGWLVEKKPNKKTKYTWRRQDRGVHHLGRRDA
jgi:hypothetical protein